MLFADEEVRHEFHKSPTLLQVVCQMLEGELFNHTYQAYVVGVAKEDTLNLAVLSIKSMRESETPDKAVLEHLAFILNERFIRTDKKPTVLLHSDAPTVLTVQVSGPADLARLT